MDQAGGLVRQDPKGRNQPLEVAPERVVLRLARQLGDCPRHGDGVIMRVVGAGVQLPRQATQLRPRLDRGRRMGALDLVEDVDRRAPRANEAIPGARLQERGRVPDALPRKVVEDVQVPVDVRFGRACQAEGPCGCLLTVTT